ncbi:hypothetical protein BC628DRAFT_1528969 [Trametes gibbosa]|nr:hypothetical protein BC628DRAFT_1528969 [Trametes gibbosa]
MASTTNTKPPQRGKPPSNAVRNPTAASSSRANAASSSLKTSVSAARSLTRPSSKPPGATTTQAQPRARAEPSARVRATTTLGESGTSTVSANPASISTHGASKTRARAPDSVAQPTSQPDELHLAAQSCAWSYMTSTIEDGLCAGRLSAEQSLKSRQEQLNVEEADIAESRVRYEAEQLLDFYDELSDVKVAEEVATMIMQFNIIERRVDAATAQALYLSALPLDDTTDISRYNDLLDTFETDILETDCQKTRTQAQLLLNHTQEPEGKLLHLLENISDILQGQLQNAMSAKSMVHCCKENHRIGIGTLTLE